MSFKNPDKLKKKKPAMKYDVKPAAKGDKPKETGKKPIKKKK